MLDFNTKLIDTLYNPDALKELIRTEIESAINKLFQFELTEFLDYEKYDRIGFNSGNSRNGYYKRELNTEWGNIQLNIPRDRNGEFDQKLIPPYHRRTGFVEDMIINMYQTGMTTSEISQIIEKLYGHHYSKQTISNISEQMLEHIEEFKTRPLKNQYSVIYMDATHIAVRRDTVAKEAIHLMIGIDLAGNKEILGYRIAPQESSFVWDELLKDVQSRGVQEVLLFVTDGLTGIENVIETNYPKSDMQRCLVHVSRNIASKVRVKDRNEILSDFKTVYQAESLEEAQSALEEFSIKWNLLYSKLVTQLNEQKYLLTFLTYPKEIRPSIYSTNLIEGFNKQLKRHTKKKEQFPNEQSLEKFIVSVFGDYNRKFGNRVHKGFGKVQGELLHMFEQRN